MCFFLANRGEIFQAIKLTLIPSILYYYISYTMEAMCRPCKPEGLCARKAKDYS
jgi:hypothetical protein